MDKNMMEILPKLDEDDKTALGFCLKLFGSLRTIFLQENVMSIALLPRETVAKAVASYHEFNPLIEESGLIYTLKKFEGFEKLKPAHSLKQVRDWKALKQAWLGQ